MNNTDTPAPADLTDLERAAAWHEEMAADFAASGHTRRAATYARNAADVRAHLATFGNASYGPYRVLVPGDFTNADPRHVVWVDYLFENGRGGTAPLKAIKFDDAAPTEEEHHCICDHCRDAGTCFGCTSGHCP